MAPPQKPVRVIKPEEKGSDVNLATHLLWDAFQGKYDAAVIISNDSDLFEPIRIVKQELGKKIVIVNPHPPPARPSKQLYDIADEFKSISQGILKSCQFATKLIDTRGQFEKPVTW